MHSHWVEAHAVPVAGKSCGERQVVGGGHPCFAPPVKHERPVGQPCGNLEGRQGDCSLEASGSLWRLGGFGAMRAGVGARSRSFRKRSDMLSGCMRGGAVVPAAPSFLNIWGKYVEKGLGVQGKHVR